MPLHELEADVQQRLIEAIADAGGMDPSQISITGIQVGPGASIYVEFHIAQAQETPDLDIVNMHLCSSDLPPAIALFTNTSSTFTNMSLSYSSLDACDPATVSTVSITVTTCIIIAIVCIIAVTCLKAKRGKEEPVEAIRATAKGLAKQLQFIERCEPRCYNMDLVLLMLHAQFMSLLWEIADASPSSSAQQRAIRQLSYEFKWAMLDWSLFSPRTYLGCSPVVLANGTAKISMANASAYSNCNSEVMSADMLPFTERLCAGGIVLILVCALRASLLAFLRHTRDGVRGGRICSAPSGMDLEVT